MRRRRRQRPLGNAPKPRERVIPKIYVEALRHFYEMLVPATFHNPQKKALYFKLQRKILGGQERIAIDLSGFEESVGNHTIEVLGKTGYWPQESNYVPGKGYGKMVFWKSGSMPASK